MCSNIEVAAERVTTRQKKIDDLLKELFETPATPLQTDEVNKEEQDKSINEELDIRRF